MECATLTSRSLPGQMFWEAVGLPLASTSWKVMALWVAGRAGGGAWVRGEHVTGAQPMGCGASLAWYSHAASKYCITSADTTARYWLFAQWVPTPRCAWVSRGNAVVGRAELTRAELHPAINCPQLYVT